jgi:hypothetical protein
MCAPPSGACMVTSATAPGRVLASRYVSRATAHPSAVRPGHSDGLGHEVGLAVSTVSCIPPIEFWRRGIPPGAARGNSTSVTTTPLRGAMAQTHHTQFVPPRRRERAFGTKERRERPPSYRPAYAATASIWGMERAGCARASMDDRIRPSDNSGPNGTVARSGHDESRESLASIAVSQHRSVIDAPAPHPPASRVTDRTLALAATAVGLLSSRSPSGILNACGSHSSLT